MSAKNNKRETVTCYGKILSRHRARGAADFIHARVSRLGKVEVSPPTARYFIRCKDRYLDIMGNRFVEAK